ncbi:hypothetical protein T03_706 [Trichinella britovi]|uniref:Uncharacterized protein n=1 Tax=Trichinella britovi TaxID=45882 RepID=A0A0V1CCX9_TRIBR|nr:hypothetical protein T03_706 [Trichinella britovi]
MVAGLKWDVKEIIDSTRYCSYAKLLHVTALCMRFTSNARLPIQADAYGKTELGKFRRKELNELCPYLDEKGILRVDGRLRRVNLPMETKHPMLLPRGDGVVKMIIRHVHAAARRSQSDTRCKSAALLDHQGTKRREERRQAMRIMSEINRLTSFFLRRTLPIQEITCWSDSRVALAWINGASARWKPFVANQVQEIQESLSPQCWRYCPANIPSRGCSLSTLKNKSLWWHSPPWLMQSRENWPTELVVKVYDNEHLTAEQKTIDGCPVEQAINPKRYSRYETLIRVIVYCLRFAQNCQSPVNERKNGINLLVKELSDAEERWLLM